ncbi:hypothetical protein LCGC14_2969400, partial [marine sediment metagenome]
STNDPDSNQHPNDHDYAQLVSIYTHLDEVPVDDGGGGNQRSTPSTESPSFGKIVSITPSADNVSGIAISATNQDDIEAFVLGVAGAGGAAVAVSAAVNIISANTEAYIGSNAQINTTGSPADGQSVIVGAANDFRHIAVSGALAVSGGGSVAPAVDVTVLTNTTSARIDGGAVVNADDDVIVTADAAEDILLVGVGIAGGLVGFGGAVGVLIVNNTTEAKVGGNITAGGNVFVSANDDTDVLVIDGAVGAGLAGIGVSVGVIDLNKNTTAAVLNGAIVNARGIGTGSTVLNGTMSGTDADPTGFNTTTAKGLTVQAMSSEEVYHFAFAIGAGWVGLAGGILVTDVASNTLAYIGNAAVNQTGNGSAAGGQD